MTRKNKNVIAFVAIAMLCATPAFAAGRAGQPVSATHSTTAKFSKQEGPVHSVATSGLLVSHMLGTAMELLGGQKTLGGANATVNTINHSNIIATKGSSVDIGNVKSPKGLINASVNTMNNATVMALDNGHVGIGNINSAGGIINASVNTLGSGSKIITSGGNFNIGNIEKK